MKTTSKFNRMKLTFNIIKNTPLLPNHFKNLIEQALIDGYKTEDMPFLHSKVNGLIFPAFVTEEQLRICSTFKTRPDDVFLVTYPKSGTMWLSQIVRSIANLKDSDKERLIGGTVPMFEVANYEQLEALPSPRYIFTHFPFSLVPRNSEHKLKYIYLSRNPRDVAVSYFHFMLETAIFDFEGTWEEFLQYFMKGDIPNGSYFDHVLEWWQHKDDENILFLNYEKLKHDLQGQVKVIAEFLGFNFSDNQAKAVAEKCTFQAMKSNSDPVHKLAKFFRKGSHLRKGIVGDWKNHFSDEQLEQFNKLYESRMKGIGLEFEFQAKTA